MIDVRRFDTLGGADHGWLKAKHHFSFADYRDSARMGWGAIRVWNDDEIAPKSGFPPHPHRDMEIITYVREGAITHEDSLGNKGRTTAGDVQVMSAGTGVRHAEYNLEDQTTRIFQIWIIPDHPGGEPAWGAAPFPKGDRAGKFVPLASGVKGDIVGDGGVLPIRTDARVLGATIEAGQSATYSLDPSRHAYLVSTAGAVEVNGVRLEPRDGAAVTGETAITVKALADAEVVLVDAA
jgi:redox-sensitive bicupin YhaK (pirin superfamily)